MTARDVYEHALNLIDTAEGETGTEDYERRAPAIIGVLQRELAFYEGVVLTEDVKDMDDMLQISDDTATRVLPYGLAASFALADKNGDMYNDFSYMYRSLCRTIRRDEMDTIDEYGVLEGM